MVINTEVPAGTTTDVSLEQRRKTADLDAKLAAGAERSRANAAARAAKGEPSTVAEIVQSKFASVAAAIVTPEPSPRITSDDLPIAERRHASAVRSAFVPKRFARDGYTATLDNFIARTAGQEAAHNATAAWLRRALDGEPAMLALIGPQGTGKSHLLYAAANALLDADVGIYARPWYILADELRYGGHHPISGWPIEADEVRRTLLRPSWKSRVWLLDEVRATAGTMFDDTELTKLACFAYDACHPLMITTNVNPLADVMGAPAASRFRQVVIDGADVRQP